MMKTIFGDPVQHPHRKVHAWVGPFASDYLGYYDTPAKAVKAARNYGVVHVTYRNGEADAIAIPQTSVEGA